MYIFAFIEIGINNRNFYYRENLLSLLKLDVRN